MKLTVIGPKFLDPKKERKLTPGTYTAATTYKKDTWMPAAEMTILGMVIPMGTYAAYDDQTQNGQYSYGSEGTIEIEELANNHHRVTFEIEAQTGYVFKGSFEGDIPLEDQSDDSEDDGSSTLTEDLDMDLSYLEKAHCFPQTQIFVPGLGTIDVADLTTVTPPAPEACGYQFIDLGLATGTYKHDPTGEYNDPGKLVEGDIVRLDLLVEPGDEGKITPGTYTLSPNRYPAQMRPGVALRGYQGGEGHIGTRWLGIGSAIGNGYPQIPQRSGSHRHRRLAQHRLNEGIRQHLRRNRDDHEGRGRRKLVHLRGGRRGRAAPQHHGHVDRSGRAGRRRHPGSLLGQGVQTHGRGRTGSETRV